MVTDGLIVGFLDLGFWKRMGLGWVFEVDAFETDGLTVAGLRLSIRFNLSIILVISAQV